MEVVDLDQTDPDFIKELAAEAGGGLSACFACRTCAASCPISALNEHFNPAKIFAWHFTG